jgi:signal transduction histidine kinase
MTANAYATLVNLLGFITGGVLYAMLLAMVLRSPGEAFAFKSGTRGQGLPSDRLPLLTAILGLAWNVIACAAYGLPGLGIVESLPLLVAVAFSALGFLPAVVVHSVLRSSGPILKRKGAALLAATAYTLSGVTSLVQFLTAIRSKTAPSQSALLALTMGFVVLIVLLLVMTRREAGWRRAVWVVALSLFSVSALHLSHHVGGDYPWWVELVGHHASLPLVLAILYQDYRFALADIFLKRALALVLLVTLTFVAYATVASRALSRGNGVEGDPQAVGLLLGLWVATALLYPVLRRVVERFVDRLVLRRADYDKLRIEIARLIATDEDAASTLGLVCERLAPALTAREVLWTRCDDTGAGDPDAGVGPVLAGSQAISGNDSAGSATGPHAGIHLYRDLKAANDGRGNLGRWNGGTGAVLVPTADPPQYLLVIGELAGGRRLLSDDIAMLESIAILVARRIDSIRVTHERCERDLREQEVSKLATEAELRALRAQINPHFLFNALNTIGYLIQTSPERALDALLRLTGLLRGALQRSAGEFTTLGQEIDLIESYLEIERARFEERLRVRIDVPFSERSLRIPTLLVQPLVENAVKHGIGPRKAGGQVTVSARRAAGILHISVQDTGAGIDESGLASARQHGVGLANVEQRLKCHYGDDATLVIASEPGLGTTVDITLPVTAWSESRGPEELSAVPRGRRI